VNWLKLADHSLLARIAVRIGAVVTRRYTLPLFESSHPPTSARLRHYVFRRSANARRSLYFCAHSARVACVVLVAFAGCRSVEKRVTPSNFRDWTPEQAVTPWADMRGSKVTIHNIRNCRYFANDVYLVDYYDKSIDLNSIRGVDFIVAPFRETPALAHTMLSFRIVDSDGRSDYLALSVETRKERTESYNPVKGSARQYELIYVLADEQDVIQYRTNYSGQDVYVYQTTASPQAAREIFEDVLNRVNQLAKQPEFYDTLTNNCTTNIVDHINRIRPNRVFADLRVLLPGYSDELAYEQGLIARHGTFAETKQRAYVNPLANQYAGRDDFSEMIRRR
jgi:hypothetical protein